MNPPEPDRRANGERWRIAGLAAFAWLLALWLSNGTYAIDAKWRHSGSLWLWAGISPGYGHSRGTLEQMIVGIDGQPHVWYGIGQQLLFIPMDVILYNLLDLRGPGGRLLHESIATLVLFPLLVAAAVVAVYGVLRAVGHGPRVAFWSCVGIATGTSLTTQAALGLETAEELLYLAGGCWAVLRLGRSPAPAALAVLVVCSLMAVSLRLPHLAYLAGLAVLAWGTQPSTSGPGDDRRWRLPWAVLGGLAIAAVAGVVIDRAFQAMRFGDWRGNYITLAEEAMRRSLPALPEGFFFSFPWQTGVVLQVLGPSKGLLLYEPLLTLSVLVLLAQVARGHRSAPWGAWASRSPAWWLVVAMGVIVVPQMVFYSTYVFTFGLGHWGNRFVQAPVALASAVCLARVLESAGNWGWARRCALGAGLAACAATTFLSGYFRADVDLYGQAVFDVRSDVRPGVDVVLAVRSDHPFAFHLGRRAAMVSFATVGWPRLEDATQLPPRLWTPNYWPWQMRQTVWSVVVPRGVLQALPTLWALGWMVMAIGLGACAWIDLTSHRRRPAP